MAEETVFFPRGTGSDSMLKRNSMGTDPTSPYYSSFDWSASIQSGVDILPTPADTPVSSQGHESSDHEREDSDDDSFSDVGADIRSTVRTSYKRCGGTSLAAVRLLGAEGPEGDDQRLEGGIQYQDKQEVLREGVVKKSPFILRCTLIPSWTVKHWRCCRLCYIFVFLILLFLILIIAAIGIFWLVEIIEYRSHISRNKDLSSSAVYELTSDFPRANLYSNQLCLTVRGHALPTIFDINKVAYVTLSSEDCQLVSVVAKDEVVSQDSAFGHNYMFYWLNGTYILFRATVNITSTLTVYLYDSKLSFDLCSDHISNDDWLEIWTFDFSKHHSCVLISSLGVMSCEFQFNVTSSGYYYLCMDSTVENGLLYNLTISSIQYDTSQRRTAVQCFPDQECCLSFLSVFEEVSNPTCMFVSTVPLIPTYTGIVLSDVEIRVDQRLSVIWYCVICLVPLLAVLGCGSLLCRITSRKVKNQNVFSRGCVLYCNIYSSKYDTLNRL